MNELIIAEDHGWRGFGPLACWRPIFQITLGSTSLGRLIENTVGMPVTGYWTRPLLAAVTADRTGLPVNEPARGPCVVAMARWCCPETADWPNVPNPPAVAMADDMPAAVVCDAELARRLAPDLLMEEDGLAGMVQDGILKDVRRFDVPGKLIHYPWDLLDMIGPVVASAGRGTDTVKSPPCHIDHADRLMADNGCEIDPTAVFRTAEGPIVLGHDVTIGPHAVIEGPALVGGGSRINAHAHLHGGNLVGAVCKVGGEVDGCIIQEYSNKQHAGFLGHAVVGSWVNLGAGTCNSDLKNTYGEVRVPYEAGDEVGTARMFFGAIIGDHAKIGINAAIATGSSIGFGAQIARARTLPRFVPTCAWITETAEDDGQPDKLAATAATVMKRRGVNITSSEEQLFRAWPAIARRDAAGR